MRIELKGIVWYWKDGHELVDLVVAEGDSLTYRKHRVSSDQQVNRGKIVGFLTEMYGVKPGDIIWPSHIEAKVGDVVMSLAL